MLDTTVIAGSVTNVKRCVAPQGRIEVCNASYGYNGWLGLAGISLSGGHIVSGYTKLNDSYFNSSTYNKPEWRRLVTCQEIGHDFGLDHQDENNTNAAGVPSSNPQSSVIGDGDSVVHIFWAPFGHSPS